MTCRPIWAASAMSLWCFAGGAVAGGGEKAIEKGTRKVRAERVEDEVEGHGEHGGHVSTHRGAHRLERLGRRGRFARPLLSHDNRECYSVGANTTRTPR